MRPILTLVLLATLATSVLAPHAAAAPTCQTLERVVPVAAAQTTTTVHTESCFDVVVGTGYTYRTWTNLTYVRTVNDVTGYTSEAVAANYHSIYTSGSSTYEERYHTYRATAYDWDSPVLRNAYAGADSSQFKSGGDCGEYTNAGASQSGPIGATGAGQSLYGGSTPNYVLPCTPEDAQNTLP